MTAARFRYPSSVIVAVLLASCNPFAEPGDLALAPVTSALHAPEHSGDESTDACDDAMMGTWDFCSASCPCSAGQGDCDGNDGCEAGLMCAKNVGPLYGLDIGMDVCVEAERFAGQVLSSSGQQQAGVEVVVNDVSATTGSDGNFDLMVEAGERYVISATKAGFVPYSRVHVGPGMTGLPIVLQDAETFDVEPSEPIAIEDSRGTTLAIAANALVDANGNRPTGAVQIHMHSYDVQNEAVLGNTMEGLDRNGDPVALESAAALSVDILDDSGNRYQLAPNQRASISLALPDEGIPDGAIPSWHYDTAQGRWLEAGAGQVQGLRVTADVPHFSAWNFGFNIPDPACVEVGVWPPLVALGNRVRAQIHVITSWGTRFRSEDLVGGYNVLYNIPPHARVEIYIPPFEPQLTEVVEDAGGPHGGDVIPPDRADCKSSVTLNQEITLPTTLKAGSGDGFAQFGVDQFGTMCGCTGIGIRFNPTGEHGEREALSRDALYIFDQNQQWKQTLSHIPLSEQWCGEAAPRIDASDVMMDEMTADNVRVSEFKLTAKDDIHVRLVQTAEAAMLTQEYTFTNNGSEQVDFILTRISDIDLVYTSSWWYNSGEGNPPGGVTVFDSSSGGPSMTIDAAGDAQLDGWRLFQRYRGWGASEHFKAWGSYGFSTSLLNGIFLNQTGQVCTHDELEIDTPVSADTTATLQSRLSLSPDQSGTFITRTILDSGGS